MLSRPWPTLCVVALLLGALLFVGDAHATAPRTWILVVNPANPVKQLTLKQVSRLFMKKNTRWEDGSEVQPTDLHPKSPQREAFSKEVHGRGASAVRAHWRQMIFSGRGVPPPEQATPAAAAAFVRAKRGGIAYLPADHPTTGLKVVSVPATP